MIDNILVLCIGNICRSPMAEGLLRHALPNASVQSAGLGALTGHPADPLAVEIMEEKGIDITAHRARPLDAPMVSEAGLILTMDLEQKRHVETKYIAAKGKVYRIGEFRQFDVADPYRKGKEEFQQSFRLIAEGVDDLVRRLGRMS